MLQSENGAKSEDFEGIEDYDCHSITQMLLGLNSLDFNFIIHIKRANWLSLTRLHIEDNNVGATGCKHLSGICFPSIQTISLARNKIGDEGMSHLAKSNWRLQFIWLNENKITGEGLKATTKSQWNNLVTLGLKKNKLSFPFLQHLGLLEGSQLKSIFIECKLSKKDKGRLMVSWKDKKPGLIIAF